jgi:ribosome-binding factor A
MSKTRAQRTADQIQVILSELVLRELRDPRLQGMTVTQVLIDRELQHANVYVNALGDETRQQEVMDSLDHASSFLRREVAQRLQLRNAPHLHFHWDPTLAYAAEVDEILNQLDIPPESESD